MHHPPLKLAVIGGGSTYTPELIEGLLQSGLAIRELVLVDIDPWKLSIVGGLAQRMSAAAGCAMTVTLTTDRAPALDGADLVITQLRVGGLAARILDERIPLAYDLVGQETTGPGGFAKALRTIPVLLDLAQEMAARCPAAWLINFTNPSGLIAEALSRHARVQAVGLCNYPLTLKMGVARAFGVEEGRVALAYVGLNHLSWARTLVDGVDRTEELLERMCDEPEWQTLSGFAFQPAQLRRLGLVPSGYLRYYYETTRMVEELRAAPQSRGERVRDVEEQLLACFRDPALCVKPAGLQERGGAWYSTAAVRLIQAVQGTPLVSHILNVPNRGAVPFLADDCIVETPTLVSCAGTVSQSEVTTDGDGFCLKGHRLPEDVVDLIRRVKAYELATVEAAVTGSRAQAMKALRLHPLLEGHEATIPALLEALLTAHRAHLPEFWH
jgi:6-phospho-beta-glucosidase